MDDIFPYGKLVLSMVCKLLPETRRKLADPDNIGSESLNSAAGGFHQ
jgi:hypothetical protein